jgi:hypothetical protein
MSIIKKNIKRTLFLFLGFICLAANAQQLTKTEAGLLTEAIAKKLKKTIGDQILVKDSSITFTKSEARFSIEIHAYVKGKSSLWETTFINNCEVDYKVSADSTIDQQVYEAIFSEKFGSGTEVLISKSENGYYYPEIKFKGIIEKCDYDCHVDGDCVLTVSGMRIYFGSGAFYSDGHVYEPWGELKHSDGVFIVGKTVDVYCRFVPDMSTIQGSKHYYIRQLD